MSSLVRPASSHRCLRRCWLMPCASARPSSATCLYAKKMHFVPLPCITRRLHTPNCGGAIQWSDLPRQRRWRAHWRQEKRFKMLTLHPVHSPISPVPGRYFPFPCSKKMNWSAPSVFSNTYSLRPYCSSSTGRTSGSCMAGASSSTRSTSQAAAGAGLFAGAARDRHAEP